MSRPSLDTNGLREVPCPACAHQVAVPFFDGGAQPLATLGWPSTAEEAQTMERLPLDFVRCVECGHLFNAAFDYRAVPYTTRPNLMFNRAPGWSEHLLATRQVLLDRLPSAPVVIEIGHGEGHFLDALAAARPEGRYIGFDSHGAVSSAHPQVDFRPGLFVPSRDLAALAPDLIVSRHVLEHLTNPVGFIQQLGFAATWAGLSPALFVEVPCIDRALATGRTFDFYYEHNSHFTTDSFRRMLARCGCTVEHLSHGYDNEVVYALVRLAARPAQLAYATASLDFRDRAARARETLRADLHALAGTGETVAVWGGSGKSAAFMAQAGADAERFPLVVDSDLDKVGTFVPGTGQEIRFRDWLLTHPVDVVIIPTHWRARDIVREMATHGITCAHVLIEFEGRLVDYFSSAHPYPVDDAARASVATAHSPAIAGGSQG
jgi:hypothetical protein